MLRIYYITPTITINVASYHNASNSTRYAITVLNRNAKEQFPQENKFQREHDLPTFRPQMQEQGAHGALIIETRIIFLERRRAPDKPATE